MNVIYYFNIAEQKTRIDFQEQYLKSNREENAQLFKLKKVIVSLRLKYFKWNLTRPSWIIAHRFNPMSLYIFSIDQV